MNIYDDFYKAYRFYNEKLFDNKLGDIIITFVRKNFVKGYYSFSRFEKINERGERISEISVNPDYFGTVRNEDILSTLVHEMCHMYHDYKGFKCSSGYHDRRWANIMLDVGLIPSSTGKPGGNMTGFLMGHYIESGGKFDVVTREILASGFTTGIVDVFSVSGKLNESDTDENKNKGTRLKYSCGCSNIWGKPKLNIKCNKCGRDFIVVG